MQTSMDDPQSNPPIYVVGVDPGKSIAAWALLTTGSYFGPARVLSFDVIEGVTGGSMASAYDLIYHDASKHFGRSVLAVSVGVEGQWLGDVEEAAAKGKAALKKIAARVTATMEVAANRGAWVALAQARGWSADVLHPSQWRAALGRGKADQRKRKAVKERAIEAVRLQRSTLLQGLVLPSRFPDHLAEAMLIGQYYAKHLQQSRLQRDRTWRK